MTKIIRVNDCVKDCPYCRRFLFGGEPAALKCELANKVIQAVHYLGQAVPVPGWCELPNEKETKRCQPTK